MIDVPELDVFLKTAYYAYNSDSEIYHGILSNELKSWASFVVSNEGMLMKLKTLVEQPNFGFYFSIGRANSMYGVREIKGLCDPILLLKAPFLKIYPRLLYSYKFIKESPSFQSHQYYFRYYPKMLVRVYYENPDKQIILRPSEHWLIGTHTSLNDGKTLISYNVAVDVDLRTIVEEELHEQIPDLHDTTTTNRVTEKIAKEMPDLKQEIEANLNRILSTEEKKFKDLGNMLRTECASELRILESFVSKFESEVIQSTRTILPADPTSIQPAKLENEFWP